MSELARTREAMLSRHELLQDRAGHHACAGGPTPASTGQQCGTRHSPHGGWPPQRLTSRSLQPADRSCPSHPVVSLCDFHLRPHLKIKRLCVSPQPLGSLEEAGDTGLPSCRATSRWPRADLPQCPPGSHSDTWALTTGPGRSPTLPAQPPGDLRFVTLAGFAVPAS